MTFLPTHFTGPSVWAYLCQMLCGPTGKTASCTWFGCGSTGRRLLVPGINVQLSGCFDNLVYGTPGWFGQWSHSIVVLGGASWSTDTSRSTIRSSTFSRSRARMISSDVTAQTCLLFSSFVFTIRGWKLQVSWRMSLRSVISNLCSDIC